MSNYSLEEKKEIKKTMNIIIEEFRNCCNQNGLETLTFNCPVLSGLGNELYDDAWYLEITPKKVYLYNSFAGHNGAGVGPFRLDKNIGYSDDDWNACIIFISKYDKIKRYLLTKIESKKEKIRISEQEKKDFMKKMKKIQEDHSSDIEIDFPQSISLNKIEITKEDDIKVGTINFGSQTIRIITRGDIVLVNKEENNSYQKKK